MVCPEFCRISCHRKIPFNLFVATADVRKVSQASFRDGNAGSRNIKLIVSKKVLFDGKVGKM
jgi:hypothetical protein